MNKSNLKLKNTNPWLYGLIGISLNILLSFGIREYIAEARYIPSGAMEPTLEIHDRLIVDKISYRFHEPQRGDIVVFSPTDTLKEQGFKDAFIYRIIGLPADTVEITNRTVFINGNVLNEDYISDQPDYQWGPAVVPPGSYLTLGDNRNNSYDGHYWGFVSKENIIGRPIFCWWPPSRFGGLK